LSFPAAPLSSPDTSLSSPDTHFQFSIRSFDISPPKLHRSDTEATLYRSVTTELGVEI
jgi:hypothetical protein